MRTLLFTALLFTPLSAHAQGFDGASEALFTGDTAFTGFGTSIAMSGDGSRVVVGEYDATIGGMGHALLFVRTGSSWASDVVLAPADGTRNDGFGTSVAMTPDGTRIAVGAPYDSGGPCVRVYVRTGAAWALEQNVRSTTLARFGGAIAMSDDGGVLLAGASGSESIASYVRSGSSWTLEATFTSSDDVTGDLFGASVALSGDGTRAIVGAPNKDHAMRGMGSAYVLVRSSGAWTQELAYVDPAATTFWGTGSSVAIDRTGTRIALGAMNSGHLRFLARSGTAWTSESLFSTGSSGLGASIAWTPDAAHAIVGASYENTGGTVHQYDRVGSSWTEGRVIAGSTIFQTRFGFGVAIASDASRAAIGEPGLGSIPGRAYVYARVGDACTSGATCASGQCADGVCCDAACAGGMNDCQACTHASTGGADGRCAALSNALAPTITCRASVGACDAAEVCSSRSTACPTDALAVGMICRNARDVCDAYEICDGTSVDCPMDARLGTTRTCRIANGACDVPEVCDGAHDACPADVLASTGTECRASSAACDPAETCTGSDNRCPSDVSTCGVDAHVEPDAFVALDAFVDVDAFVAPDAYVDVDAFVAVDAGHDAGTDAGHDASVREAGAMPADGGIDAGAPPPVVASCGCSAGSRPAAPWWLAVLAILARRRRA